MLTTCIALCLGVHADRAGLLLCFFVAQPGFWAHAAHLASAHGVPADPLPLVHAASTVIGAMALLQWGAQAHAGAPTRWPGSALGLSVCLMAMTSHPWVFGAALVAFEVVVNRQSTRLQATVAERHPRLAGRWLPACVAGGAACGTAIHGAAIAAGPSMALVAFRVAAGIAPAPAMRRRPQ